jgi:hypothetical protein
VHVRLGGPQNVAFEATQHAAISGRLAAALQSAFGPTWPTQTLSNYFLCGTFDVGDIVAATAGALAAAGLLSFIHRLETAHAH